MNIFLILSLILLASSSCDDEYNQEYTRLFGICQNHLQNKDNCLKQNLESTIFYCCMSYYHYDGVDEETEKQNSLCKIEDKANLVIFKDKKLTALYRESSGYESAIQNSFVDVDKHYVIKTECNDGSYEADSSILTFSSEEKKILESEDHCLYYHNKYLESEEKADDAICQKGQLTKNAIDEGLKCGYYNITFKSKEGVTKNYKTWYLVNNDDIKSGKLNPLTQKLFEQYGLIMFDGDNEVSYSFEVTAGDDISASYDSKEGKMIDNKKGKSDIIKISKFLGLLFLILF